MLLEKRSSLHIFTKILKVLESFLLQTRELKLLIQSYNKIGEEIKGYLELVIALPNEQNWQRFFYFFLLQSYAGIKTWCKQLLVKVQAHAR